MLAGMAFEHPAITLQLVAIVADDPGGSVVGFVVSDHELQAKSFRDNTHIDPVVVVIIGPESRSRVERQARLARVGILADVQIANRAADVEMFVVVVLLLRPGGECR